LTKNSSRCLTLKIVWYNISSINRRGVIKKMVLKEITPQERAAESRMMAAMEKTKASVIERYQTGINPNTGEARADYIFLIISGFFGGTSLLCWGEEHSRALVEEFLIEPLRVAAKGRWDEIGDGLTTEGKRLLGEAQDEEEFERVWPTATMMVALGESVKTTRGNQDLRQ